MAPYPHMPTSGSPSGTLFRSVIVNYVGTGLEGFDFNVPIGATAADNLYAITWASAGGLGGGDGKQTSGVEVVDLPLASRTTTQFRVVLGQALAAGDKLQFVITGSFT